MNLPGLFCSQAWTSWAVHTGMGFGRQANSGGHGLPVTPPEPSALLAQALAESSNLALDWEWYAARLSDPSEREYCLARARWIGCGLHG